MRDRRTPEPFNLFIVNPAPDAERIDFSVSTPRALPVLAAVTPDEDYIREIRLVDEAVEEFPMDDVQAGDLVGLSIHTANVIYAYELAADLRARGATVVFGGPHASIFPEEVGDHGDAVVQGDAEVVWAKVLQDHADGELQPLYKGRRVDPTAFTPARWDLMKLDRYLMASVQTVRGCPKQCSFCSVWVQDGQVPRVRTNDAILQELRFLYKAGFRTVLFADDNFYPYTLESIENARTEEDRELQKAGYGNRLELLERLVTEIPDDMKYVTQITMEVADDPEYLAAMRQAGVVGVLIGIESVTEEGLAAANKSWNSVGDELEEKLERIRTQGPPYILGSLIFGLETDTVESLQYTIEYSRNCGLAMAQFIAMVPFPGTVDFALMKRGKKVLQLKDPDYDYWLDPDHPRVLYEHPNLSDDELLGKVDDAWKDFYSPGAIFKRAKRFGFESWKGYLAYFILCRGLYTRYRRHGLSQDSAVRGNKRRRLANLLGRLALKRLDAGPVDEPLEPLTVEPASDSIAA